MRLVVWNMRRASPGSAAWDYLLALDPDIALLQEVGGLPEGVTGLYYCASSRPKSKAGKPQRFENVIVSRLPLQNGLSLTSDIDWVQRELEVFSGNIQTAAVLASGQRVNLINLYSPAWPVKASRLENEDVSSVKLSLNPDVWCTDLVWEALRKTEDAFAHPLIVGGDFNSSETFDYLWSGGPRGNLETIERFNALGLTEALRGKAKVLAPTFRNPKGGKVIHQLDHLYLTKDLWRTCSHCRVGEQDDVFSKGLSDHLPIIAELGL